MTEEQEVLENKEETAEKREETNRDVSAEKSESESYSSADALKLQAARYLYIEKLENRLSAQDNLTSYDLNDIMHCKAQVLLELVGVSGYISKMPADSPLRKAADVLLKHLYKCYDKTESLREKVMRNRQGKRSQKQWEEYTYSLSERNRRSGIVYDEMLLPPSNVIDLTQAGLTAGTLGLITQFIQNPSASIKAQMPELISEFASKITGEDEETTHKYITSVLEGLTKLKKHKSMSDVLEGVSTFTNLLGLNNGNAL